MTVHPKYPELGAQVVVNDVPLQEYDDKEANRDRSSETITTYVQVVSDAHFGIRYTIPKHLSGEFGVRTQLLLDGKRICTFNHSPRDFALGDVTHCMDKFFTTMNGGNYEQRFRFSQLQIDEDAEHDEQTLHPLKPIGTVTLTFRDIRSVTKRDRTPESQKSLEAVREDKLPVLGEVSEKSLKGDAKSHQASLDVPVFTGVYTLSRSKTKTVRDCGKPFASFRFKYRSLDALKSLHIVERTPSPSATPPPQRAVEDMSREELEAIARDRQVKTEPGPRTMKLKGRSSVKREAGVGGAGDEVEFVRTKRKKAVPSREDEVIVLD